MMIHNLTKMALSSNTQSHLITSIVHFILALTLFSLSVRFKALTEHLRLNKTLSTYLDYTKYMRQWFNICNHLYVISSF